MAKAVPVSTPILEPVGHCIYCGRSDLPLSCEHIVPYGLGGSLELPKASCHSCARITSSIERFCLRETFLQLRTRHQLPTRRPKERPHSFPVQIQHLDSPALEKLIRGDQLPSRSWFLPVFDDPGFLKGSAPGEELSGRDQLHIAMSNADVETLGQLGHGTDTVSMSFGSVKLDVFARLLAKIAHVLAYALLGADGFKPYCRDLILKGTPDYRFLVGGSLKLPQPTPDLYQMCLVRCASPDGRTALGVMIRLFAFLGTPQYGVIVGEEVGSRFSELRRFGYSQRHHPP